MNEEMTPVFIRNTESPLCLFNMSVDCPKKDNCKSCGWNPDVDAKRRSETRKRILEAGWTDEQ